jgi:hypothetical protein
MSDAPEATGEPEITADRGGAGNRLSNDDDRYDVGYGKPPRANQFQPGKSGNPRGRPKGAKGLKSELRAELDEFVTITVDGKSKRIRKRRLVIKALAAKAAKGNVQAADKLLSLVIQAEGFEDERPTRKPLSDTDQLILKQMLGGDDEPDAVDVDDTDRDVGHASKDVDSGSGGTDA